MRTEWIRVVHLFEMGLAMLPRVALNSWAQAILLLQPLEWLRCRFEPLCLTWTSVFKKLSTVNK
jgi:hypothetical protein